MFFLPGKATTSTTENTKVKILTSCAKSGFIRGLQLLNTQQNLPSVQDNTPEIHTHTYILFSVAPQHICGLGHLTIEVSRSHTIRHRHTYIHCTTPPNEWSARRRGRYVQTHSKHKSWTTMGSTEFKPCEPNNQAALDLHLGPQGHWDLPWNTLFPLNLWEPQERECSRHIGKKEAFVHLAFIVAQSSLPST